MKFNFSKLPKYKPHISVHLNANKKGKKKSIGLIIN